MKATAKALIGRTITAVEFRPFKGKEGYGICHNPVLTLDNGRRVYFMTEETGIAEYGTLICISDRKRRRTSKVI